MLLCDCTFTVGLIYGRSMLEAKSDSLKTFRLVFQALLRVIYSWLVQFLKHCLIIFGHLAWSIWRLASWDSGGAEHSYRYWPPSNYCRSIGSFDLYAKFAENLLQNLARATIGWGGYARWLRMCRGEERVVGPLPTRLLCRFFTLLVPSSGYTYGIEVFFSLFPAGVFRSDGCAGLPSILMFLLFMFCLFSF